LADGRVLSFNGADYKYVEGKSHSTLVSGIAASSDGKVFSVGYDDQVREISSGEASFTYVSPRSYCLATTEPQYCSQASCPAAAQPRSVAVAGDTTIFVVEIGVIEAIRSNQKVHEIKPKYTPTVVAAFGSTVAIGTEVCTVSFEHRDQEV
jgi:WD repeat-containing protein 1 (actin-interacting protein 1)